VTDEWAKLATDEPDAHGVEWFSTTNPDGTVTERCQHKIQTREHLFKNCPQWKSQQKTLWATVLEETRKLPGPLRGWDRTSIAELLADERCSQAVLDSLATTDVGRTSGPLVASEEEDAVSEASEWEAREQAERDLGEKGGRRRGWEGIGEVEVASLSVFL